MEDVQGSPVFFAFRVGPASDPDRPASEEFADELMEGDECSPAEGVVALWSVKLFGLICGLLCCISLCRFFGFFLECEGFTHTGVFEGSKLGACFAS